MPRAVVTIVLLLAASVARAASIAVAVRAAGGELGALPLLAAIEVAVPLVVAVMLLRARPAADAAALALAALGTGHVMATGLAAVVAGVELTQPVTLHLVASGALLLAGATTIGRWQDTEAPAPGTSARAPRVLLLVGALLLGGTLISSNVAVLGRVALEVGTLPGPVAIATTLTPTRAPLLLAVLLVAAWAASRRDAAHRTGVAAVLAARAAIELGGDLVLRDLGLPLIPLLLSTGASTLLVIVAVAGARPRSIQVTSSST